MCPLPMDEAVFGSLQPGQSILHMNPKPGFWAHLGTLTRLLGPIQGLNRSIARHEINAAELDGQVCDLSRQLQAWSDDLPSEMQMTVHNLNTFQQKHLGGPFIALHLAYHHYFTMLYFRYLENSRATSAPSITYVSRCKEHASGFSSLLRLSGQMKDCSVNCAIVGHMTVVSSSVLLHTLLLGNEDELEKARQELHGNFESLIALREQWPATAAMVFPPSLLVILVLRHNTTLTDLPTD